MRVDLWNKLSFQGGRPDSLFCKSTPPLEIGHSLLDIGYFRHLDISPIPHFHRELHCAHEKTLRERIMI